MKHSKLFFGLIIISLLLSACKKGNDSTCWFLVNNLGVIVGQACGKSEAEMNAQYGSQYGYFRTTEPLYCWKLAKLPDPDRYISYVSQYIIDRYYVGYTASIISCNSFCNWKLQFRHKSKLTGLYSPNTIKMETIMNTGDTCSKLYVGRVFTVNETTDSLHTAECMERY